MEDALEFDGVVISGNDLVSRKRPTSWPDIFSTDVNGTPVRWQFADADGPCSSTKADRILFPFAQGRIAKGKEVGLRQ